jgi:hypothetical protein
MRKNVQEVFDAWTVGRELRKTQSIWTDGDNIFSYGTAIATFGEYVDEAVLNVTKYSPTTSNHQNALRVLMERIDYNIVEVDALPFGVTPDSLFNIARMVTS